MGYRKLRKGCPQQKLRLRDFYNLVLNQSGIRLSISL